MLLSDIVDLNTRIASYFQSFFKEKNVNTDARLIDLGFESIDYIELAAFLLKTTGKWLDISKINDHIKISDIESYLLSLELEKPEHKKMVKLNALQRYSFTRELNNDYPGVVMYIIHYLQLKEHIDLSKLKQAIKSTLNNHYILNTRSSSFL